MSTFDNIWNEFMVRFSRAPVWLPGTSMSLGDIGIIDRRGYIRLTSLSELEINYREGPPQPQVQTTYYAFSKGVTIKDIELTGGVTDPTGAVGKAEAGMHMTFSAEKAFVLRAAHAGGKAIANVLDVENEIRRRHAVRPFWEKDWIYVQEIVTAQPCIMVVSEASGAKATVKATGSGPGLSGFGQLFEAGAALELSGEVSSIQQIVTSERTPFMWRGRWLRGKLRKQFGDRGNAVGKTADDEALAEDDSLLADDDELAGEDSYVNFDDPTVFAREEGKRGLPGNSQ